MLYSLSILALKKEKERNSKSINHMGQWHTAFRLHELNFSVVGIIYRIGPQEYPLLVLQSDYLEQSFRKKIAKSEVLCHSRCGMKEIPQWPKDITVLTSWHIKSNILTRQFVCNIFELDIMQNINNLITCYMWQLVYFDKFLRNCWTSIYFICVLNVPFSIQISYTMGL